MEDNDVRQLALRMRTPNFHQKPLVKRVDFDSKKETWRNILVLFALRPTLLFVVAAAA